VWVVGLTRAAVFFLCMQKMGNSLTFHSNYWIYVNELFSESLDWQDVKDENSRISSSLVLSIACQGGTPAMWTWETRLVEASLC
jgi:hypothetical protein